MSTRGGVYEGPGGQKLYGDGREVDPVESVCICSSALGAKGDTCTKCSHRIVVATPLPETGAAKCAVQPRPKCKECGAPILRDGEKHGIVAPPRLREPFYLEDDAEPAAPPAPSAPPDAWNSTEPLTMQPKYAAPRPTVEMPALVMPVHRAYCQKASYRGLPCTCERRKGERRVKQVSAWLALHRTNVRHGHDRRAVAPTPQKPLLTFHHVDAGIRRAVIAMNEVGIVTYESCEGGEGHAFTEPTISFNGDFNEAVRAVGVVRGIGLVPWELRRRWRVTPDNELEGPHWDLVLIRKDADEEGAHKSSTSSPRESQAAESESRPSTQPATSERAEDSGKALGGITEGVEEARRWLIERGFEPYGEAAMQKEIESHLAFAADRTRVLQDRNKTLLRRTELLQAGYQDASAQVTALTIQKMQLEADGADVVVIRQRDNLSRAMLKQLEARKAAESALAQANAKITDYEEALFGEQAKKDEALFVDIANERTELRTSLAAANAEIKQRDEDDLVVNAHNTEMIGKYEADLAAAQGTITPTRKLLNALLEEHPCWAGGIDANGVCAQPCDRCDPIRAMLEQLTAADTSCFDAAIREATAKERERCAKIAQEYCGESSFDCAEKIRLAPSSLQEQTK